MLYSYAATSGRAFEIEPASIGALAGLVSITAACSNIGIWEGAFSGFVGGVLACYSREWLERLQIDDPVGAIPVHFVGGIWGLLVVGFFNRPRYGPSSLPGIFYGGGARLLGIQLLGSLAITAWGVLGTYLALRTLLCCVTLRVSRDEEKAGLDVTEHGVNALASAPSRPEGSGSKMRPSASKLFRTIRKRIRRKGAAADNPTSPSPTLTHLGEFVEDVGQAANVQASVRSFVTTLRTRARARGQRDVDRAADAHVDTPAEAGENSIDRRSDSNELVTVVAVASP